jgi:hypothetical protein
MISGKLTYLITMPEKAMDMGLLGYNFCSGRKKSNSLSV